MLNQTLLSRESYALRMLDNQKSAGFKNCSLSDHFGYLRQPFKLIRWVGKDYIELVFGFSKVDTCVGIVTLYALYSKIPDGRHYKAVVYPAQFHQFN